MRAHFCLKEEDPLVVSPLKGFTLTEVLVITIIVGIIAASLLAVFYVGDMSWRLDQGLLDLHQGARRAMDGMVREIRQSSSSGINITSGGERVEFYIPTSSYPINYYLSSGQIIREHPQDTIRILANNINFLNFSISQDTFRIHLQAAKTVRGKNLSFSLTEKARLRNE